MRAGCQPPMFINLKAPTNLVRIYVNDIKMCYSILYSDHMRSCDAAYQHLINSVNLNLI